MRWFRRTFFGFALLFGFGKMQRTSPFVFGVQLVTHLGFM